MINDWRGRAQLTVGNATLGLVVLAYIRNRPSNVTTCTISCWRVPTKKPQRPEWSKWLPHSCYSNYTRSCAYVSFGGICPPCQSPSCPRFLSSSWPSPALPMNWTGCTGPQKAETPPLPHHCLQVWSTLSLQAWSWKAALNLNRRSPPYKERNQHRDLLLSEVLEISARCRLGTK